MKINDPLSWFITDIAKADFVGEREGGFVTIEPRNDNARTWLESSVDAEAMWYEGKLVVEMRYIQPLMDAILAAGFLFAR